MTTCDDCHKEIPDRYIMPSYVNGTHLQLCPDCALASCIQIHGLPDSHRFTEGSWAEYQYDEYQVWKQRS